MNVGSSTSGAVGVSLLKQSLDLQAQTALTLINSIPQQTQAPAPAPVNLPAHLGQNINVTA